MKHILIADDDAISQTVLKTLLEQSGCNVSQVADGKKAIEALQSGDFDLVLMDCMMPVMDGFTATRAIRCGEAHSKHQGIPIIALTGLSGQEDRDKCLAAGMNDYLVKPVEPARLQAVTQAWLGGNKVETEAEFTPGTTAPPSLDAGILDRLIGKFLEEIPSIISDLEDARAQQDLFRLKALGHRLRGAADVIGFSTLSRLATDLEHSGLQESVSPALIRELHALSSALSKGAVSD